MTTYKVKRNLAFNPDNSMPQPYVVLRFIDFVAVFLSPIGCFDVITLKIKHSMTAGQIFDYPSVMLWRTDIKGCITPTPKMLSRVAYVSIIM